MLQLMVLLFFGYQVCLILMRARLEWMKFFEVSTLQGKTILRELSQNSQRMELSQIESFIADYFDDSPITQHIIKLGDNGVTVKIGDDHNLVEVNFEQFLENPVEALEQARMEWMNLQSQ